MFLTQTRPLICRRVIIRLGVGGRRGMDLNFELDSVGGTVRWSSFGEGRHSIPVDPAVYRCSAGIKRNDALQHDEDNYGPCLHYDHDQKMRESMADLQSCLCSFATIRGLRYRLDLQVVSHHKTIAVRT